jgi:transposase-like protein
VTRVTEESAEIFDDLYLGLRAGGAIRKQRRGEPLTTEEREGLARLPKENRELRMERDILKRATAFFAKHQQ